MEINLEELNRYIKENNLNNNVKILNNIDNPFPYLLRSDLFILSSITKIEGLPNVLLEAYNTETNLLFLLIVLLNIYRNFVK